MEADDSLENKEKTMSECSSKLMEAKTFPAHYCLWNEVCVNTFLYLIISTVLLKQKMKMPSSLLSS